MAGGVGGRRGCRAGGWGGASERESARSTREGEKERERKRGREERENERERKRGREREGEKERGGGEGGIHVCAHRRCMPHSRPPPPSPPPPPPLNKHTHVRARARANTHKWSRLRPARQGRDSSHLLDAYLLQRAALIAEHVMTIKVLPRPHFNLAGSGVSVLRSEIQVIIPLHKRVIRS